MKYNFEISIYLATTPKNS